MLPRTAVAAPIGLLSDMVNLKILQVVRKYLPVYAVA